MRFTTLFLIGCLIIFASCESDNTDDPSPDTSASIDFVGKWNRDSVIVYDVYPSKLKVRLETEFNYGFYIFNSDLKTGVLNLLGSDFGITWKYTSSNKNLFINEIDWENMDYSVQTITKDKLVLIGSKDTGSGNQNERVIYLSKKN
ncbi:MAG: hypothetical protein LW669_05425 [Sphingobacteriales bacterium]|jgi:hypothetical protein|nr:hypothetical protein [Sphingobacteriales bacterium]